MNILLDNLLNSITLAIVHFIWQGLLVGLVAWLALHLARHAKPQVRYAIACLFLLLCALLPIAQFMLRTSSEPVIKTLSSAAALEAGPSFYRMVEPAWYVQSAFLQPILPWILVLWIAGVAIFSLRLLLGLQWIAKTRHRAMQLADERMQEVLDDLLRRMEMPQTVLLRMCPQIDTPMAMGILRPLVLLPIGLLGHISTDTVEALLAHELAHIKRHDYLINLLQRVVETLLFYHPVVWCLSHRIRQEREHIADDLAAQALGSPRRMAIALTQLSEWQPTIPLLANLAHGGNLMKRITRLIKPQHTFFGWKAALPALALALVCVTVVAKQSITLFTANSASTNVVNHSNFERNNETFAIVKAGTDSMMMSGSSDHIDAIKKTKKLVSGDFMWFSRNGEAFVIRDPAVLLKVATVWQPTEKLSAEMDVLSTEMDVHSRKMDVLSGEMDKLAESIDAPSNDMRVLASKREQLAGKYEDIASRRAKLSNDADLASLDAREAMLDKEQARLDSQQQALDSQLEKNQSPMEQIGSQMEMAGKPMEALGKQMEVLGKQMEKLNQIAEKKTQIIISEASSQGLAQPVGKL